jgi:hypothetical protein
MTPNQKRRRRSAAKFREETSKKAAEQAHAAVQYIAYICPDAIPSLPILPILRHTLIPPVDVHFAGVNVWLSITEDLRDSTS